MVVIKIELWPGGDESRAQPLGLIGITNDGTGSVVARALAACGIR